MASEAAKRLLAARAKYGLPSVQTSKKKDDEEEKKTTVTEKEESRATDSSSKTEQKTTRNMSSSASKLMAARSKYSLSPVQTKPTYQEVTNHTENVKADEDDSKKASGWEIAKNALFSGLGQFNRAMTSTLDFVLPTELVFGGEEKDPISKLHRYYSNDSDRWDAALSESVSDRSTATRYAAELGKGTVAALPQAVLALMTGGGSVAAQGSTMAANSSGGLASTIANATRTLFKNPSYWLSAAQTIGPDYEEAKSNGASEIGAIASALISGYLNSAVEVGGGLDTLPSLFKQGGNRAVTQWVKSALEEGREEVVQGIISGIVNKATYDTDRSWFSTEDEDAIINPMRMLKEYAMGSAVGGILGGAQVGALSAVNAGIDAANNRRYERLGNEFAQMGQEEVQSIIEEGLSTDPSKKSYKLAKTLQEKISRGENVTSEEVGRLYRENVKYIDSSEIAPSAEAVEDVDIENAYETADETLFRLARESVAERMNVAQPVTQETDTVLAQARHSAMQEQLSHNRETKKRTVDSYGYGENGTKAFTDVLEKTGVTPEEARTVFQTPYEAGLSNTPREKITFDNDVQIAAYDAGRMDAIVNMHKTPSAATAGTKSGFHSVNAPKDVSQTHIKIIDNLARELGSTVAWDDGDYNGRILEDGSVSLSRSFSRTYGGETVTAVFHAAHEIGMHRLMQLAPKEGQAFINAMYGYLSEGRPSSLPTLAEAKTDFYGSRGVKLTTSKAMEEVVANSILDLYDGDIEKFHEAVRRVAQGNDVQAKKGLAKFREILAEIAEKLHRMVSKLTGKERAEAKQALSEIEQLRNMYEEALSAAIKQNKANEAKRDGKVFRTTSENGMETVETSVGNPVMQTYENGTAQLSLKTYEAFGRAELKRWLDQRVSKNLLAKEDAAAILKELDEYYDICQTFKNKYAPFGAWSNASVVTDNKGKPVFSVVKANGEYAMNLDFSLVCKKRRTLDAVFGEMIRRGMMDNVDLGQEDISKINDIIRESGFETACALCFVDAKRYRQAQVADAFVNQYNELVRMLLPGGDVKAHHFDFVGTGNYKDGGVGLHTIPDAQLGDGIAKLKQVMRENSKLTVAHKIAKHLLANPQDRKLVVRGEFMNTDGFDAVRVKNERVLSLYNSSKGSGGPKAAFSDVQYLGEILKKNNFTPERAYAVGGVRIQSFSDYVPRLVFDYMQMIGDLAAKKLPAHAYTKEAMFAMQFGMTGIKVNMSLVPAVAKNGVAPGLDANGDYLWFDGQSFGSDVNVKGSGKTGYELAVKIQNAAGYSANCGTIAVGVSDAHIRKMLDDPNIRMVIPYHKSSLNHIIAVMNNIDQYKDYTGVQNTRSKATGSKISGKDFNYNAALRKHGDAKAAANEYLAWCEKNGYIPKFDDFAKHENYYKLLEDFSTYDGDAAAPQGAVTMTFPKDGAPFGSMTALIEQGLEEDAILEGKRDKQIPEIVDKVGEVLKAREQYSLKEEEGAQYSLVEDEETLDFLNQQEWVKVYRAMYQDETGLYPPMGAIQGGKRVDPVEFRTWYQADEHPELIKFEVPVRYLKGELNSKGKPRKSSRFLTDEEVEANREVLYDSHKPNDVIRLASGNTIPYKDLKSKFELVKADGGSDVPAAYNPYFHTSLSALNDQFSTAYKRPGLVVVEGFIPKSELTSGYQALYAKDPVGETTWKSGVVATNLKGDKARKVFLSRWFRAERVVSDTEAAGMIAKVLEGENLRVPWNVVTPALRNALEQSGVDIDYDYVYSGTSFDDFQKSGEQYSLKYDYGTLVAKPDMRLSSVDDTVEYKANSQTRKDIVREAVKNAAKIGKTDAYGGVSVYVGDVDTDVILSTHGLQHGLDRRLQNNAAVIVNAGEILRNAIRINELTPKKAEVAESYVLLGAAKGKSGTFYVVEFVVNRYDNTVSSVDVLYSVNAKKESAVLNAPAIAGSPLRITDSTISIAQLLEFARESFPDVLPESVLRHFGFDRRPDGALGESSLYSLKEDDKLLRENAKLKEVNAALKEQFKLTKVAKVDKKSLDAFAKSIIKDYQSGADIVETRQKLDELFTYIANGEDGQAPVWEDVWQRAYETAAEILENASVLDDEMWQSYKGLRDTLRTTGVSLDKRYESDLGGYENLSEFRKANFGRILLKNDGIPVDVFFGELAYTYPEYFDADETTHPADQLLRMAEVLDELAPTQINPFEHNMREAATWLASDIIDRFYELPQAKPTFADKAERKLTETKIRDQKKLEALRDKKDARIKKLIEESREKLKTVRADERAKRQKAVKETKEHYKTKEAKASENRKASVLRGQIIRHVQELQQTLLKPNDKHHIPENLRKPVAELLDAINLESQYVYDPETGKRHKDDGTGGDPTRRTIAFDNLRKVYKQIIEDDGSDVVVDPYIELVLERMSELRDVKLADMSRSQLEEVWSIIRFVEHSVLNAGKTLSSEKFARTVEWAEAMQEDTETRRRKRGTRAEALRLDLENPYTFFSHYGDAGKAVYRMLRDAQDRQQMMVNSVAEAVGKIVDPKTVRKLEKEVHTFKTERGESLTLTKAQIMDIYLLSKREQAQDHLLKGGIVQPEVESKKIKRGTDAIMLTMEDLMSICGKMTVEERTLAIRMQELTSTVLADYGNEASLKAYGYKKFTGEDYWPIKSAKEGVHSNIEKGAGNTRSIKNIGLAKAVMPMANNPLDIGGIFKTFASHAADMTDYAAWLCPMEDANRLFNFQFRDEDGNRTGKTIKGLLDAVGGKNAQQYWHRLMEDIQNGIKAQSDNAMMDIINKGISNARGASVGANIRVIVQQPTAILRAAMVLNPADMAKGMIGGGGWKTALAYSPIAQRKDMGGFDISSPMQMQEILYDSKSGWQKFNDAMMWVAGKADSLTWGRIWSACEASVKRKHKDLKPKSAAFYKAVNDLFTEVIDQSQVVDGVLQRTQAMRSSNALMNQATAFMGEPMMSLNMLLRAYEGIVNEQDGKKRVKAIKNFGRAAVVLAVTNTVNALAQSLIDALRDDEDDEYWNKFWAAFKGVTGEEETLWEKATAAVLGGNLGSNMNPVTYIPFAKDALSLLQGYNVTRADADVMGDIIDSFKTFTDSVRGDGKKTIGKASFDLTKTVLKVFGNSAPNIERDIMGLLRTIAIETDNVAAQYEMEKWFYKVGNEKNTNRFVDIMYKAYETDKAVYEHIYNDLMANGVDAEKVKNRMETKMKKAQGVTKVSDLESRYLPPDQQSAYDKQMKTIKSSNLWKGANADRRDELESNLYDLTVGNNSGEDLKAKIDTGSAYGIDETEYLLYRMALDVADTPNKKGKLGGTPTNAEKADAISMMGSMSDSELAYLWDTEQGYEAFAQGIDMESYINALGEGYSINLEKLVGAKEYGIGEDTYFDFVDMLNEYDKPTENGKLGTFTQDEAKAAISAMPGLSREQRAWLWQSVNKGWKDKNNPWR